MADQEDFGQGNIVLKQKKHINMAEQVDRYEEIVNVIIPILDEMDHLKKYMDTKTFNEITDKLKKYILQQSPALP